MPQDSGPRRHLSLQEGSLPADQSCSEAHPAACLPQVAAQSAEPDGAAADTPPWQVGSHTQRARGPGAGLPRNFPHGR